MTRSTRAARLVSTLAALLPLACARDSSPPPLSFAGYNVVLISIDTLRSDRLGSYGHAAPTSPRLDRLARSGVVFEDVLAAAPTTAASHRSMFTGRHVYEHANDVEAGPAMAEIFREAGWATAAFVDGGQLGEGFGFQRGFDQYVGSGAQHVAGAFLGGGLFTLGPQVSGWLDRDRSGPFFLFLHTYDVHCPYSPPLPYRHRFAGAADPGFEIEGKCGLQYFNGLKLDRAGFEHVSDLYDAGIRHMDRMLGRILDDLDRVGVADRTIVVVTSDHGEALGERRRIGHNQVFDVQVRIPLLLILPGAAPRVIRGAAHSVDLLPTLTSLVEIAPDLETSGIDLSDAALGRATLPSRRFRISETGNTRVKTVRTDDRWSLVLSLETSLGLYDLHADPEEKRSLIRAEPAIAESLRAAVVAHGVPFGEIREMPGGLDESTVRQLEALGYVGN